MFPESHYKLSFPTEKDNIPGIKIYTLVDIKNLHASRYVEVVKQNMYAGSGATEETIRQHLDAIIELCNQTGELKTIRTDIAGIANALKMRTKFPIDKHVAVRMGIVMTFAEIVEKGEVIRENPDECIQHWLDKKMELALKHPALYSFFFTMGAISMPAYNEHLDSLNDLDYFDTRMMNLMAMLPESHSELSRI